jgi:hypothetical protein
VTRLYRVELKTVAYVLAADERSAEKIAERAVFANDHSFDTTAEQVQVGHEIDDAWWSYASATPYEEGPARTRRPVPRPPSVRELVERINAAAVPR